VEQRISVGCEVYVRSVSCFCLCQQDSLTKRCISSCTPCAWAKNRGEAQPPAVRQADLGKLEIMKVVTRCILHRTIVASEVTGIRYLELDAQSWLIAAVQLHPLSVRQLSANEVGECCEWARWKR